MSYTIDEALLWLYESTGATWTTRKLLYAIMWCHVWKGQLTLKARPFAPRRSRPAQRPYGLVIRAVLPVNTKFGVYQYDTDKGTPSNPFVRQCNAPWQPVSLWQPQIEQLFHVGETMVSIAERPEDDYGQPGQYVLIEPLDTPLRVTLSMVRIPGTVLHELASVATNADTPSEEPANGEAESSAPAAASPRPADVRIAATDLTDTEPTAGRNDKAVIDAYIDRRARVIFTAGEASTAGEIAELLKTELESKGFRGERGTFLRPRTIESAIPKGLTGGRAKNGRKTDGK